MAIKHSVTATGGDSAGLIGQTEWNADHTGTPDPAGADKQIQFNDNGTLSGDADLTFDKTNNRFAIGESTGGGKLCLCPSTVDPSPVSGKLLQYVKNIGGRLMLKWLGPSGIDTPLQPFLGMNRIACWQGGPGTNLGFFGAATLTATGTATAKANSNTNYYTRSTLMEYLVTVAATTAVAGFRFPTNNYFITATAGAGGFFAVFRVGPATGVATTTSRFFTGFTALTAAPTDVEPSTMVNCIGFGYDAADANCQIFTNSAAGTATKTDLGVTLPVRTVDRTTMYEVVFFVAPGSMVVNYRVIELNTGTVVSGTVSTKVPADGVLMSPRGYASVGGTSSVIGIAMSNIYIETDY